ncbi:hypothetical protein F8388_009723 [Cannabis sativa]|uniref:Uncharacterized protein n=1 Tax=Cannabis sativa TaxID=3483 RepID=A0A7J6H4U0_CANSA|nr:hypothetical protein F8388_009723 [Cannabis sativa]
MGSWRGLKKLGMWFSSWAPQSAVLRHRSTGAFLSHCGWNSIVESLSQGVPMIAWPLYAEQKMNATILVEEVGVAVKLAVDLRKGIVTREEIKRAVSLVINNGGNDDDDEEEEEEERNLGKVLRLKARKLKLSAEKALRKDGGSSYDSLTQLTNDLMVSRISS